jgi:AI-2 transport protein TqsA
MKSSVSHPALTLLLIGLILLGLIIGQNILIPLVMAFLLTYLIDILRRQVAKIRIKNWTPPKWMQMIISTLVLSGIIWFIGSLLIHNLKAFQKVAPEYNDRILMHSKTIAQQLDLPSLEEVTKGLNISEIVGKVFNSSIAFLSATFVVVFYVVFLFLEEGISLNKLKLAIPEKQRRQKLYDTIKKIDASMYKYFATKSFLSLIIGIITLIVLESFGVDFAFLWAFLAFLLNFIPFIGAFVAIVFPVLISFLQHGDPLISISLLSVLVLIQVIMGNIIEPRVIGKSLNLSPLVVLLSLSFWGAIWGVAGMFLCVPITVTLMIVLNQFPNTKPYAIMLSAGHDIDAKKID